MRHALNRPGERLIVFLETEERLYLEQTTMNNQAPPPGPVVREIEAKSILNASKVYDYCINPYTGCQVACVYCYAALFMRRYSGHAEPWGGFVDVKINAPGLLARQIDKAKKGTIWIASVCDPYQPLEKKYALTRRLVEALIGKEFPVVIQSKSALLRRDLDVIRRLSDVEVGFTIATEDETSARSPGPCCRPCFHRPDELPSRCAGRLRPARSSGISVGFVF
jgi:hypothetical protein